MTTPDNALIDLRALAEAVKDWVSADFWPEAIAEEDDDLGITVVGRIDEDGNEYPVAVIDADAYGDVGESLKLAEFYAAANPAAVLALLDRITYLETQISMAQEKDQ